MKVKEGLDLGMTDRSLAKRPLMSPMLLDIRSEIVRLHCVFLSFGPTFNLGPPVSGLEY